MNEINFNTSNIANLAALQFGVVEDGAKTEKGLNQFPVFISLGLSASVGTVALPSLVHVSHSSRHQPQFPSTSLPSPFGSLSLLPYLFGL